MPNSIQDGDSLINKQTVSMKVGFGKTKLAEMIKNNQFPQPIRFSQNCIRWRLSEVNQWIEEQAATRNIQGGN
ncbi:helix-turn-helix transcriptional regulator [Gallibacterium melopsittaci]|uniref:Helix-turn-helix transcriptional regulator n=1 Tax=Gallibacterium melopsittaci TaxID=516063 RepID=A0ABV6HYN6_9PAST